MITHACTHDNLTNVSGKFILFFFLLFGWWRAGRRTVLKKKKKKEKEKKRKMPKVRTGSMQCFADKEGGSNGGGGGSNGGGDILVVVPAPNSIAWSSFSAKEHDLLAHVIETCRNNSSMPLEERPGISNPLDEKLRGSFRLEERPGIGNPLEERPGIGNPPDLEVSLCQLLHRAMTELELAVKLADVHRVGLIARVLSLYQGAYLNPYRLYAECKDELCFKALRHHVAFTRDVYDHVIEAHLVACELECLLHLGHESAIQAPHRNRFGYDLENGKEGEKRSSWHSCYYYCACISDMAKAVGVREPPLYWPHHFPRHPRDRTRLYNSLRWNLHHINAELSVEVFLFFFFFSFSFFLFSFLMFFFGGEQSSRNL
jgi:hypothetical protein